MSLCGVVPLVVVLEDQTNTTLVMITLEKRLDIDGFIVSGSLDEMQQFSDRMKGCYQIIIEPFEPYLLDELMLAFEEEAGPHVQLDTSEVFTRKGELILEAILKPHAPDFANEGDLYPGTSITACVFPELKYSSGYEYGYPQPSIVGVDRYVDTTELIDWDSSPTQSWDF